MPLRAACAGGKTVQLSKGRGSEKRNWKRGWMGGKKPAHGSRQIVKMQGSCISFAFIHRLRLSSYVLGWEFFFFAKCHM